MASVEPRPRDGSPRRRGSPSPSPPSPPSPSPPRRDDDRPRHRVGADRYRPARPPPKRERSPPPAAPVRTEQEKQQAAKAEYEKLLNLRSGGVYIPPARLRALQAQITDKTSKEYQRMAWEALKKSINGLINKVNVSNIKHIVPEIFAENLVRGRGLFCQSIVKAQAASLPFTPIYAAVVCVVNCKLPSVGELLASRLVLRFRKAYRRNDKPVCLASSTFIAHLANQQVVHEMVVAQMLLLLLQKPTDDSVDIAVGLTREVGQLLDDLNPAISNAIFDQFRNILHEADLEKRTQYAIEVLFQVRKDRFKDNPAIRQELDLVEEEDMVTHKVELDGELDGQDGLNVFKFDQDYEENEAAYKKLKGEILGQGSDYEDDEDDDGSDGDGDESEAEDEQEKALEIKDQSNADLVSLRRTIYLVMKSSADPEEATHKLLKLNIPAGLESELPMMVLESAAQERTYLKFYGLIGERIAKINRLWMDLIEQLWEKTYESIHRYDTNKLRNAARWFGHLLSTDAIGWHVLSVIHLNEEETTSASRIFIKILFQDVVENMGMQKLQARLKDDTLRSSLAGLFPHENPRNIRFSINYFTSIGMGALTEEMRQVLQNMPKPALPAPAAADESESDSVSSYSSYTGSSYSSRSRSRTRSRTPPRRAVVRDHPASRSPSRRGRSASPRRRSSRSYSSDDRYDSPPRRQAAGEARPRHRSRRRRESGASRTPSRPRSQRGRRPASPGRSASPPPRRRRNSSSVSASPPRRRTSYSASPPPPQRRAGQRFPASPPSRKRYRDYSRSRSASSRDSPSRSPPPRGNAHRQRDSESPRPRSGGSGGRKGRRTSYSRSRSPVRPRDEGRHGAHAGGSSRRDSRLPSPIGGKRRRRYSSSRSRSPVHVKRGRRSE